MHPPKPYRPGRIEAAMTPNQVVAHNLYLARALRGWTQEQAADKLEPHLGVRLSKASYSAAERSVMGDRIRQFDANDLHAFARAFDLPMTWFLLPPLLDERGGISGNGPEAADSPAEFLERLVSLGEETSERLTELFEHIPREAQTTPQRTIADRSAGYAEAILTSELGDLSTRADELRALAGVLEQAQQQAATRVLA